MTPSPSTQHSVRRRQTLRPTNKPISIWTHFSQTPILPQTPQLLSPLLIQRQSQLQSRLPSLPPSQRQNPPQSQRLNPPRNPLQNPLNQLPNPQSLPPNPQQSQLNPLQNPLNQLPNPQSLPPN